MDTLLTLLFFAAAAGVSAWLKRKQGASDDVWRQDHPPGPTQPGPSSPAGRPALPPPGRAVSWEAELRRLLGEGQPAQPPFAEPEPPPVAPRSPLPAPALSPPPVVAQVEVNEEDVGLPVHFPTLQQSAQSYLKASQLDKTVQKRLEQIDQQVAQHRLLESSRWVAPELVQARSLLRDPVSLRAALIASVILGPPKAFEGSSLHHAR